MPTLDQLTVGQRARVESVGGTAGIAQRLMEMGVLDGEEVEVIAFAPFGDPMEILVRDYRLSLRLAEARGVRITLLDGPSHSVEPPFYEGGGVYEGGGDGPG